MGAASGAGQTRDLQPGAVDEVAFPAGHAVSAVPAEPAHRNPLAWSEALNTVADRVDAPGDLVTRDQRECRAGLPPADHRGVRMTDSRRLDRYPDLAGPRLGELVLDQAQRPCGLIRLC
jgi:hypothetical protein